MPTPSKISVTPGAGTDLDSVDVDAGVGTVKREGMFIGDDTTGVARARVSNAAPASNDYGLASRTGDGHDVNAGATTDAAVVSDANGTMSAKLRGLVKILASVWDNVNGRLKVDGSAVTQPVSAASLPLPTGASTAAKQPALGTAGTASADVITVQGAAGMTPVKVDGSAATQPVSGTVTANAGANLNTSALALEAGGNLAAIKTDVDKIPSDPAREGGILTTIDADLKATQPRDVTDRAARLLGHVTPDGLLGQALMLASIPVTLASDQVAINDRFARGVAEASLFASQDGEWLSQRGRGAERYSISDRRGSVGIRGSVR